MTRKETPDGVNPEGPPAEPTCSLCSKPIRRPRTATETANHDLVHTVCLSRTVPLSAVEEAARARANQDRAARLFEAARLRWWGRLRAIPGPCPVCRESAMVLDWWPRAQWTVVEDCPCGGFFIGTDLVRRRVPRLSPNARHDLAVKVRECRTKGREVWITTRDGQFGGPIVIHSQRPSPR